MKWCRDDGHCRRHCRNHRRHHGRRHRRLIYTPSRRRSRRLTRTASDDRTMRCRRSCRLSRRRRLSQRRRSDTDGAAGDHQCDFQPLLQRRRRRFTSDRQLQIVEGQPKLSLRSQNLGVIRHNLDHFVRKRSHLRRRRLAHDGDFLDERLQVCGSGGGAPLLQDLDNLKQRAMIVITRINHDHINKSSNQSINQAIYQ